MRRNATTKTAPVSKTSRETAAIPKIDFVIVFEGRHVNPNGDPDKANAPRQDRHTGVGLVTPECTKRKLRNYFQRKGYPIFIEAGSVLGETKALAKKANPDNPGAEMCRRFIDVRLFGGLLSANKNAESKTESFTGPVQITFAESVGKIYPDDHSITRCAAENARTDKENKTMGQHHAIPYAVYYAYGSINPFLAAKTGMTPADLDLLIEGLNMMFETDQSTQRGLLGMKAIYAFRHESPLGTAGLSSIELLESIQIRRRPGVEYPTSFADFELIVPSQDDLPKGITLEVWKQPFLIGKKKAA